ncbi:MAG TPA: cysteine-rich CWC family protein [Burkholderiaceae bacterium]|nr:cysteine-rich CWC family protein [Burkholderiaceae bacterium]
MNAGPDPDRCPRCGEMFDCGANDAAPCPCTTLALDAKTLADLRARYTGCLCLRCLAELSNQPAPAASAAPPRAPGRA